ncbi:MAG: sulfotransferase domain-containing protein [Candidatus Nealsonbacteria bacterium]
MEYKDNNFKIEFMIIGAPKSATTWIAKCLDEHSDLSVPNLRPEYFLDKKNSIEKYKDGFKKSLPNQIKGMDFPNFLFFGEKVINKIKNHNLDMKLIVCLRNPIERAYSHYLFSRSMGNEYRKTFEKALEENELPYFIEKGSYYKERGFYYKQIKKYLEYFPFENFLILIYEDIKKDPKGFIQGIYKFLNVDANFETQRFYHKYNYTTKRKFIIPFLNNVFARGRDFLKNSKFKIIRKFFAFLIRTKIANIFEKIARANSRRRYFLESKPLEKPVMNSLTREYLLSLYKTDIADLEKLINRDLSFWK